MKHNANIDLNFQIGGKTIIGERLENFSKKYGLFTKTFNIAKKELTNLGNTRKVDMINKSNFAAYINIKKLSHKFGFRNLDSNKENIIEEIEPLIKQLQEKGGNSHNLIVMPLFIRSNKGLATDVLYVNISHKKDNKFLVDIERVSTFSETDKSDADKKLEEIGEIISDHFHVELHDDTFDIDVSIKNFKFEPTDNMNLGIDIIKQNLMYTLYFLYKRLHRVTVDLETVFFDTMSYSNNTDFVQFLKKTKLLEELEITEKSFIEKLNQNIVERLKQRPDKKTKKLISSLEETFASMKDMYNEFENETLNLEQLTEGIEEKTAEILKLFEEKNQEYKDLNNSRIVINNDIEKIYAEFVQLKDAIAFGMDNLIEHRGIILQQLKKFDRLQKNSKYYEDHKEVFEKIKEDLNKMVQKQTEFDNKIMDLKDKLAQKKDELKEKKNEIQKVNIKMKDSEKALGIIQKKLQKFKQEGGNKKSINFLVNTESNRRMISKKNQEQEIYLQSLKLKDKLDTILNTSQKGGKIGRPPSKSKLDKAIDNFDKYSTELKKSPANSKKKTKVIVQEFLPVLRNYQKYIETYHKLMDDRQILKDTLRNSYVELRKQESAIKLSKEQFKLQDSNIKKIIKKIDDARFRIEDNPKGQQLFDKLQNHKESLVKFINSRGDYNDKVEKINNAINLKKADLDSTKNQVRLKLLDMKKTGKELDLIKKELEEKTSMYGGSILKQSIQLNDIKQDKYLRYLMNPLEFILKGGKNDNLTVTDKNINNWIKEEPEYIFENFTKKELQDIAVNKFGLRTIKNQTKTDLANRLKFILYGGKGFVTQHKDYLALAALLKVDLINTNKNNLTELKNKVNLKLKQIKLPFLNNIQQGGAIVKDTIKIKKKLKSYAIAEKIIIRVPMTQKEFMLMLRSQKNSSKDYKKLYEVLKDSKSSDKISIIKNKKLESSHDSIEVALKYITSNIIKNFSKNKWIRDDCYVIGSYLNKIKMSKDPSVIYTDDDYIPIQKRKSNNERDPSLLEIIERAHSSQDFGIIMKGNDLIALVNQDEVSAHGFKSIIQQTAKQLANVQSVHLNNFTDTAQKTFKRDKLASWKSQVIYKHNIDFQEKVMTKLWNKWQTKNGIFQFPEDMRIEEKDDPHNHKLYANKSNPDFFIAVLLRPQSRYWKLKKNTYGKLVGWGLLKNNDIGWVIVADYAQNLNGNPKFGQKRFIVPMSVVKIISFKINVFSKDKVIMDILNENFIEKTQSGGSAINLIKTQSGGSALNLRTLDAGVFDITSASLIKPKKPAMDPRVLSKFSGRGNDLMDQYELSDTIKVIGDKLLELGQNPDMQKQVKNKIAVFNVMRDDENNVINRDSLMTWLDQVSDFLLTLKENKETRFIRKLIKNIRDYYKGNEFTAIIKSKKQVLYEEIEKLSKMGKHLPPLQKEIANFIKSFDLLTEKFHKNYLSNTDRTWKTETGVEISGQLKSKKLEIFINNIKKIVYSGEKHSKKRTLVFNKKNFPVDSLGQAKVKLFVRQIEKIYEQTIKDETDLYLLDKLIGKLEILHLVISEWVFGGLKYITNDFDFNSFANLAEAKKILKSLGKTFYKENEKAEADIDSDRKAHLQKYYPREEYFAHIHPVKAKDKDLLTKGTELVTGKGDKYDNIKDAKKTIGDGKRWLNKIEQMKNKLVDMKEVILGRLYEDLPMDEDDATLKELNIIQVKEYIGNHIFPELRNDYFTINKSIAKNKRIKKTDEKPPVKVPEFDDLGQRIKIEDSKISEKPEPDRWEQTHQKFWNKSYRTKFEDKWLANKQADKLEDKDMKDIQGRIKKEPNTEFGAITDYKNDLRFLEKTLGDFLTVGGAMMTNLNRIDGIVDMAEYLEDKILDIKEGGDKDEKTKVKDQVLDKLFNLKKSTQKELLTTLQDKNSFNNLTDKLPVSILGYRNDQLSTLSSIKTDVAKLFSGGALTDKQNESEEKVLHDELEVVEKVQELIRDDDMGTPDDLEVSESMYKVFDEFNQELELPTYKWVSDTELVTFMGWPHIFETEIWNKDKTYHGKYEDYINHIVSGKLFDKNEQEELKAVDTGELQNMKWIRLFYIKLMNWINMNNIKTFYQFLLKTYPLVPIKEFQNGEYPQSPYKYNDWWNKTMVKVGTDWNDKIAERGSTAIKRFQELTSPGSRTDYSKFEKSLIVSFIIHSKSLLQEDEDVQLSKSQKYNKFREIIPKDTAYLLLTTMENNNEEQKQDLINQSKVSQSGGARAKDINYGAPISINSATLIDDIVTFSNFDPHPGSFLLHKNLDGIKELYIYDKGCKQSILRDRPELERSLHIPTKHDFPSYRNLGIGASFDGSNKITRIPRIHKDSKELRQCAEYRLVNSKTKKEPDWTIWDIEKEVSHTGEYKPLILWPLNQLNRIEKGLLCIDTTVDGNDRSLYLGEKDSRTKAKEGQQLKYRSLEYLIETSYAKFPDFKDSENTKLAEKDEGTPEGYIEDEQAKIINEINIIEEENINDISKNINDLNKWINNNSAKVDRNPEFKEKINNKILKLQNNLKFREWEDSYKKSFYLDDNNKVNGEKVRQQNKPNPDKILELIPQILDKQLVILNHFTTLKGQHDDTLNDNTDNKFTNEQSKRINTYVKNTNNNMLSLLDEWVLLIEAELKTKVRKITNLNDKLQMDKFYEDNAVLITKLNRLQGGLIKREKDDLSKREEDEFKPVLSHIYNYINDIRKEWDERENDIIKVEQNIVNLKHHIENKNINWADLSDPGKLNEFSGIKGGIKAIENDLIKLNLKEVKTVTELSKDLLKNINQQVIDEIQNISSEDELNEISTKYKKILVDGKYHGADMKLINDKIAKRKMEMNKPPTTTTEPTTTEPLATKQAKQTTE